MRYLMIAMGFLLALGVLTEPAFSQDQSERYRARITGQLQGGGPVSISTTQEWPKRDQCMVEAQKNDQVAGVIKSLQASGQFQNLNIQCRKVPVRNTNAVPNLPGSQGTSQPNPATLPISPSAQPSRP